MAYRQGPADPRLDELRALLEAEPTWRDELVRVRFVQDEHVVEVDRLETEIAERVRGGAGVVKTLKRMFAGGNARELERLRRELDEAIEARDKAIAREREVAARLDAMTAARAELAERERDAIAALRAVEGPTGDELRALATAVADETAAIEEMQRALRDIEGVNRTMQSIRDDLDQLQVARRSMQGGVLAYAVSTTDGTGIIRARLETTVAETRGHLRVAATVCDGLRARWPALAASISSDFLRSLGDSPDLRPIEHSQIANESYETGSRIETLMSAMLEQRRQHEARRTAHLAREREIIHDSMRGAP